MADFFDYDPLYGVKRTFDYDESVGDFHMRTEQDVEPLLRRNAEARAIGAYDSPRRDLKFYASIPATVIMELRKKGIDIFRMDADQERRFFHEINTNYPLLKVTDKVHR